MTDRLYAAVINYAIKCISSVEKKPEDPGYPNFM
jgi:hypothetical protein